ncbi:hypothetical protein [Microbulbifer yueqingensis]|uniref:Uncharacterized protein n=1 Tax=Microbulbifer yueqingensis TaxID=658219 RepID=A0A1G8UPT4_9GAMM|nr:hypothetical protein [Microbulbifer yueqingensis]SDJ55010.1 hypothetical protein SAMN05216212_0194 [Microbulbifer yueqingensis]
MKSLPRSLRLALGGAAGGLVVALVIDLLGAGGGALPYVMYPVAGLMGGLLGSWIRRQKGRRRDSDGR